jgi:hypothetical protein
VVAIDKFFFLIWSIAILVNRADTS